MELGPTFPHLQCIHSGSGIQSPAYASRLRLRHPGLGCRNPGSGCRHPGSGCRHPGCRHPGGTPSPSSHSVSHLITLCSVFTTGHGVQPLPCLLTTLNSFSPTPPVIPFSSLPSPFLSVMSCSVYPTVLPCLFFAGTFAPLPSPTCPFPRTLFWMAAATLWRAPGTAAGRDP